MSLNPEAQLRKGDVNWTTRGCSGVLEFMVEG